MQPCIYLNHFRLTINRVFLWHISSIFQTRHTIPIPAQVPVEKKFQNPHGIIILKPLFQFKLSWQANTCTLVQKGNQKSSAKTQPLPDQFLPNQQKTQFHWTQRISINLLRFDKFNLFFSICASITSTPSSKSSTTSAPRPLFRLWAWTPQKIHIR